jgi:hypothetical protein
MAEADHSPECDQAFDLARNRWNYLRMFGEWLEDRGWGPRPTDPPVRCPGGCITDTDRALWKRLADEADAHLNRHTQDALIP